MIIHIEICDVCRRICRGGLPVETFSSGRAQWDVGHCCAEKPFTVVKHTDVVRGHLLARVEALVVTELSLISDPLMEHA